MAVEKAISVEDQAELKVRDRSRELEIEVEESRQE